MNISHKDIYISHKDIYISHKDKHISHKDAKCIVDIPALCIAVGEASEKEIYVHETNNIHTNKT